MSQKSAGMTTLQIRDPSATSKGQLRYSVMTNRQGYVELDLSRQELASIPAETFHFSRIEILNLSRNEIIHVQPAIARLRGLRVLLLQENRIASLPDTITNCLNLRELDLTRNRITYLPRNFGILRNLQVLKLGQNEFECLTHDLGFLENLRHLDIQGNRLWYMPFSVQNLNKLKYLNMASNRFEHLPMPICKITTLKYLNLRSNCLINLAPDFEALKNIKELNLAHNRFENIPQTINKLKDLQYLNIAANSVRNLPSRLTGLNNLQVLHLQGNKLESLPDKFHNLQYLNVANNRLYNISVANMKKLKSLNVNNNFLENLPMGLYSLTHLESLRLNGNQIRYISVDIAQLKRLKTLDLGNNLLTSLPQVIDELDRLDFFNVKGNNIHHRIAVNTGVIQPKSKNSKRYQNRKNREKDRPTSSMKSTRTRNYASSHNFDPSTFGRKSEYKMSPNYDPSTFGRKNAHKMWDFDDLLQEGFSKKSLLDNSASTFLAKKTLNGTEVDKYIENDSDLGYEEEFKDIDFKLLGICSQVECFLNKDLLQPVLSLKGHDTGKSFSQKSIVKTPTGLWRIQDGETNRMPGIIHTKTEVFTMTSAGGLYTSTSDPNVSVFVPARAIDGTLHASLKIVRIESELMHRLKEETKIIDNITAMSPILFLQSDSNIDFSHEVTITMLRPVCDKRGYLHLLTIKGDNTCIPIPSGYQTRKGYITLNCWQLSGKVALLTKAKCKYKACKSVETLLQNIQS